MVAGISNSVSSNNIDINDSVRGVMGSRSSIWLSRSASSSVEDLPTSPEKNLSKNSFICVRLNFRIEKDASLSGATESKLSPFLDAM